MDILGHDYPLIMLSISLDIQLLFGETKAVMVFNLFMIAVLTMLTLLLYETTSCGTYKVHAEFSLLQHEICRLCKLLKNIISTIQRQNGIYIKILLITTNSIFG